MRKIIVWSRWIDDVYLGTKPPDTQGGAELQMAFWAKQLAQENNRIFTFSWRSNVNFKSLFDVHFLWIPWIRKIGVLFIPLKYIYLFIIKPDIVIIRNYEDLKFLFLFKKILNFKLIYMFASDNDVEIHEMNICNSWQKYLIKMDGLVAQNNYQALRIKQLIKNQDNKLIIIPNIFDPTLFKIKNSKKKYDFIWVANIKPVKRVDWFIKIAETLPQYKFAIIGAITNTLEFNLINDAVSTNSNISYMGYLDIHKTTQIIAESKILINTSEKEGFPNTFLQSWSLGIPVISTVDPSNIIESFNLGYVANSIEELIQRSLELISSSAKIEIIKSNIENYFTHHHSSEEGYKKINQLFS